MVSSCTATHHDWNPSPSLQCLLKEFLETGNQNLETLLSSIKLSTQELEQALRFTAENGLEKETILLLKKEKPSSDFLGHLLIRAITHNLSTLFDYLLLPEIQQSISQKTLQESLLETILSNAPQKTLTLLPFVQFSEDDRGTCLIEACKKNLREVALALLNDGNITIRDRATVAEMAIRASNYTLLEKTLQKGELLDRDLNRALSLTMQQKKEAFALLLLDHNPISHQTREQLLITAAKSNFLSLFRILIQNAQEPFHQKILNTAFLSATFQMNFAMVKLLVDAHYEPDVDTLGTAILFSGRKGNCALLEYFLEFDLLEMDDYLIVFLEFAGYAPLQVMQLLLKWYVPPKDFVQIALQKASRHNRAPVISFLRTYLHS